MLKGLYKDRYYIGGVSFIFPQNAKVYLNKMVWAESLIPKNAESNEDALWEMDFFELEGMLDQMKERKAWINSYYFMTFPEFFYNGIRGFAIAYSELYAVFQQKMRIYVELPNKKCVVICVKLKAPAKSPALSEIRDFCKTNMIKELVDSLEVVKNPLLLETEAIQCGHLPLVCKKFGSWFDEKEYGSYVEVFQLIQNLPDGVVGGYEPPSDDKAIGMYLCKKGTLRDCYDIDSLLDRFEKKGIQLIYEEKVFLREFANIELQQIATNNNYINVRNNTRDLTLVEKIAGFLLEGGEREKIIEVAKRIYDNERGALRSDTVIPYCKEKAKNLPYPLNYFVDGVLLSMNVTESALKIVDGNQEYQDDRLRGFMLVFDLMPEKNRRAIEYRYRDKMKCKDAACLMGCSAGGFSNFLCRCHSWFYRPKFRIPLLYGYKETEKRGLLPEMRSN